MISRIFTLKTAFSHEIFKHSIRRYASKRDPNYCPAHMNELPVPCGEWAKRYAKKQFGYTIILLFGAGFFVTSFTLAYMNDALDLNFYPPECPAPQTPLDECT